MSTWFSVDPGGPVLGWALWYEDRLVEAGLSRSKSKTWQERAVEHRAALYNRGAYPGRVACECMRVRGGRGLGNPQILVELNGIAGHVGTEWYEPGVWKGRVEKEIHQPRILLTLTDSERKIVEDVKPASLAHNAVDAVGIGLYVLGRLTPATRRIKRGEAA